MLRGAGNWGEIRPWWNTNSRAKLFQAKIRTASSVIKLISCKLETINLMRLRHRFVWTTQVIKIFMISYILLNISRTIRPIILGILKEESTERPRLWAVELVEQSWSFLRRNVTTRILSYKCRWASTSPGWPMGIRRRFGVKLSCLASTTNLEWS